MKTANDLLRGKGNEVFELGPDALVYDAIKLMSDKGVGALMIIEGGRLVGVISERDYARKVILKGLSSKKTRVRDIMTSKVITAGPDENLEHCMGLMTNKRFRHLPIVVGDQLIGVISMGDIVKSIMTEQLNTIVELERYIRG
jgi:CBS domain-containing protein